MRSRASRSSALIDREERSRNVIAFSLWGSNPRYLRGALTNATVARYLYPGWMRALLR